MPRLTATEHHSQAQSNDSFYEQLGKSEAEFPDWAMTALFYAAVHYVQAGLVHLKFSPIPRDHKERKAAVREKFKEIAPSYEQLEGLSRRARYDCVKHPQTKLALAELQVQMIRQEIEKEAPSSAY